MNRISINNLSLWQFENFAREKTIRHFVTEKDSNGSGGDFTLSFSSSPDKEHIRHNRKLLASALTIPENHLVFPSQVHKTRIVEVTPQTTKDELMETDALITREKNLCIAVMSADCVPILLFDRRNLAVGAVHSGWRGTVAKILEKTLQEMQLRFGTKGEDLIAGIGPSVSQDAYEVGEEVIDSVIKTFGNESGLLASRSGNKAKLDLWKANKLQLLEFGVSESQIEISDLCTVKNNDNFFSARKGDAGRFAAGIMLA
jgi:YfiH family protein